MATPQDGDQKKVSGIVVAGVIIFGGIGALLGINALMGTTAPRSGTAQVAMPMTRRPVVTMAKFNSVKDGMSYDAVRAVIGSPGEEMSRSTIGGFTTVMYQWTNSNGTGMNATFQDDKLVMKAQFGLP